MILSVPAMRWAVKSLSICSSKGFHRMCQTHLRFITLVVSSLSGWFPPNMASYRYVSTKTLYLLKEHLGYFKSDIVKRRISL